MLHGVMRVGLVSKGLLLKGDGNLELVLLCSSRPTVALLREVAEKLTAQLEVTPHTRPPTLALVSSQILTVSMFVVFPPLNRRSRRESIQSASVPEMRRWL